MEGSIITNNMEECFICHRRPVEIHHVLHGRANRKLATKYKLVLPLCREHHQDGKFSAHKNAEMDLELKKIAQGCFEREYPDFDFRQIFGRNYI